MRLKIKKDMDSGVYEIYAIDAKRDDKGELIKKAFNGIDWELVKDGCLIPKIIKIPIPDQGNDKIEIQIFNTQIESRLIEVGDEPRKPFEE